MFKQTVSCQQFSILLMTDISDSLMFKTCSGTLGAQNNICWCLAYELKWKYIWVLISDWDINNVSGRCHIYQICSRSIDNNHRMFKTSSKHTRIMSQTPEHLLHDAPIPFWCFLAFGSGIRYDLRSHLIFLSQT